MFPRKEKSFTVVDIDTECEMNPKDYNYKHLLVRSPILNEKSCYTSDCHAHSKKQEVLGSFVIRIPLQEFDADLNKSYFLATLTTLSLVLLLIFFTRRRIKKPLMAIVEVSEAVAGGDTETRLKIADHQLNDMRTVSIAINNMLDNLQEAGKELANWSEQLEYKIQKKSEELGQAQNELINIERIASLGKLSLSVAHEINNPLSGILIYTKLIQKQLKSITIDSPKKDNVLKNLRMIENETNRCGDIVKGLLDFSSKRQDMFEVKNIHETLIQTANLMDHTMKISSIQFITEFKASNDLVYCNPNQIKQACIAILVNANEAIRENGEIIFRTLNPENGKFRIEIIDNGVGIPEEALPHIFEPFFSTKSDARGIGLGLAIVHGIVQSHEGTINIKSKPGKGTRVAITLPNRTHKTKDNG
jgi:two-component system NtrC family sensor kinase